MNFVPTHLHQNLSQVSLDTSCVLAVCHPTVPSLPTAVLVEKKKADIHSFPQKALNLLIWGRVQFVVGFVQVSNQLNLWGSVVNMFVSDN